MSISNFYKRVIELLESISGGGGGGGGATETTLQAIDDKLPALSGGKIPVEVGSLNVTVDNANLEISNDVGNPVPASIESLPLPTGASTEATVSGIDGRLVDVNSYLGLLQTDTTNLGISSETIITKLTEILSSFITNLFSVVGTRSNAGSDTSSGKTHLTIGGSDGTNLRPLSVTTSGSLNVTDKPSMALLQTYNLVATTNYSLTITDYYPCLMLELTSSGGSTFLTSIRINNVPMSVFSQSTPENLGAFNGGTTVGYLFSSGTGNLSFSTGTIGTSPVLKIYGLTDVGHAMKGIAFMQNYWFNNLSTSLTSLSGQYKTTSLTCAPLAITTAGTPSTGTIAANAYQVSIRVLKGSASITLASVTWLFNADEFNANGLNPNGYPRAFTWTESPRGVYPAFSYTVDANSIVYFDVRRN